MSRRSEESPEPAARAEPCREAWTIAAYVLGLLTLALYVYLGSRPGGSGPILAYRFGPTIVGLAAALGLIAALIRSIRHRPVLQRGRTGAFLCLAACLWIGSFPLAYPSSHQGSFSAVAFRLPVEGLWRVRWGGDTRMENALVLLPSRRFGFDLVGAAEVDGRVSPEAGFGAEVLAPAAGTIVRTDEGSGYPELGSFLVIRVAPAEFLFLACLQRGSIRVREGESVHAGDLLARVGRSARSRFTAGPHLSIHLQDTSEPGSGEGIPMRFHDYEADGRHVERGVPHGGLAGGRLVGQLVRAASPP